MYITEVQRSSVNKRDFAPFTYSKLMKLGLGKVKMIVVTDNFHLSTYVQDDHGNTFFWIVYALKVDLYFQIKFPF